VRKNVSSDMGLNEEKKMKSLENWNVFNDSDIPFGQKLTKCRDQKLAIIRPGHFEEIIFIVLFLGLIIKAFFP